MIYGTKSEEQKKFSVGNNKIVQRVIQSSGMKTDLQRIADESPRVREALALQRMADESLLVNEMRELQRRANESVPGRWKVNRSADPAEKEMERIAGDVDGSHESAEKINSITEKVECCIPCGELVSRFPSDDNITAPSLTDIIPDINILIIKEGYNGDLMITLNKAMEFWQFGLNLRICDATNQLVYEDSVSQYGFYIPLEAVEAGVAGGGNAPGL